jgi:uracil-DNA glycosylase
VKLPPSLRNIYKELEADLGVSAPETGDLSAWAEQGVLLLNTVLTVAAGRANSHKNLGWQAFTREVIAAADRLPQPVVFLLWGAPAQKAFDQATGNRQASEAPAAAHSVRRAVPGSEEAAGDGGCGFFASLRMTELGDDPCPLSPVTCPPPRLILTAPHPSPLSAYRGFFGSRPFSRINAFLTEHGEAPIRWV